ncbi:MAG: PASTA domain-containing protein, partial [Casimicrobium sp.]
MSQFIFLRSGSAKALLCALAFAVPASHAAEHKFSLLLDTDNAAATGCVVATADGSVSGVERVNTAVVTTTASTAMVSRLDQQTCVGGALTAATTYDAGGWSAGLGNGTNGSAAIEFSVPLSSLPRGGTLKALAVSRNALGQQDATGSFLINVANAVAAVDVLPVPLSKGLAALIALLVAVTVALRLRRQASSRLVTFVLASVVISTLAWAATVARDGNIGDWIGVSPAVTDASGDAPLNADILAVYHQQDANNLYVRIDADVRLDAPSGNLAPVVNAGPNQTIVFPATANLSGSAIDDGLPNPPAVLSFVWTKFSGPGTVTFAAATSAVTTATFSVAGSYVLRLTVNDSALTGSSDVTIAVNTASNAAPVVSAGPNQTITLPAVATMAGTASDDGLPNPPAALTATWTFVSGPINGVVFANAAALNTTVTFTAAGTYVLKLTATDSILSTSSTVQIIVLDSGPKLVAIADRTIPVGVRFRQVLAANDANSSDTLAFTLTAAPTGAVLNPSPVIDWTPGNAQLGPHTFAARVSDAQGHTDDGTFKITVVAQNRAPQLAALADASIPQGAVVSRTLVATDPDGDVITFAVSSAPAGVTISGPNVTWPTAGVAVGDYAITVKASDPAGLFDAKRFTVKITPSAAPVAVDDTYSTRLGQTLTIPAPGVLGNDFSASGGSLSAVKLTDPDKGTISAFNANGGFTYQAPATPPGSVFTPVLRHNKELSVGGPLGHTMMIDLDGDGKPEMVFSGENHGVFAIHADTGNVLWAFRGDFFTGCSPYLSRRTLAAADIDDDGKPEVIFAGSCAGDNGAMRIVALNGQDGTVKWISPALAAIPVLGDAASLTDYAMLTIARLHAGESPSVLINVQYAGLHRYAISGFDAFYEPACRLIVETVPDGDYQPNPAFPSHYQQCRGVIVLSGNDGTVRQRMIAKKTPISGVDGGTEQTGLSAPVVVDLDGDGTPEIVAGGVVFNLDGTPRWQGASANVLEVAVGNFDDTPDIEVVRFETQPGGYFLTVYKSDGAVLWRLPFDFVTFIGKIVVGDLDGDGKADIVFNYGGLLCAIKHDGTYRWCNVADVVNGVLQVNSSTRVAIFDFDGDGVAEVVMQTNEGVFFLDGLTGKLKASFPITTASTGTTVPPTRNCCYVTRAPLVGDVDADGHADLIFFWVGEDGISWRQTVLKAQNNDWRPARGVQNQFAYHFANINDNGTIPTAVPLPNNFAVPRTNVFGTQVQMLAPVDPRKATQTSFTYKVNDGTLDSAPATVKVEIAPVNRPPVFDSIPPTRYFQTYLPFSYTAHATDPDVGDTVTYRMVFYNYNGATCSIGATSGVLSCDVPINQPTAFFLIAATDSFGAETVQSVQMTGVTTNSTVPNVIGLTQAAAGTALTTAGLAVGVVTLATNPAPAGQVIAQVPAAGATSLSGEAVALNISSGPAPVFVPFVVGKTEPVALALLSSNGFTTNIARSFSLTVPRGEVMSQSPTAGTLLAPVATNPVAVTVSAGSGIKVRLSQDWTTANQSVTATVTHVDINGVETPFVSPAPVLTVVASDGRNLGALPAISGNTVTPALDSLGTFTVRAADTASGAQDSAVLAVVAPTDGTDRGIDLAAFAEQARLIAAVETLMRDALAAGQAGDLTTATAKATQGVQLWRGFDQRLLRLSAPFSPPDGLPPTPDDVLAHGTTQTAEDLVNLHLLETTVAQFTAMVNLLQDPATTKAQVDALLGPLVETAKALGTSNPGLYGIADAQPEYAVILSRLLPDLMDAMMNRLGDTVGLPDTEPSTKRTLIGRGG